MVACSIMLVAGAVHDLSERWSLLSYLGKSTNPKFSANMADCAQISNIIVFTTSAPVVNIRSLYQLMVALHEAAYSQQRFPSERRTLASLNLTNGAQTTHNNAPRNSSLPSRRGQLARSTGIISWSERCVFTMASPPTHVSEQDSSE